MLPICIGGITGRGRGWQFMKTRGFQTKQIQMRIFLAQESVNSSALELALLGDRKNVVEIHRPVVSSLMCKTQIQSES